MKHIILSPKIRSTKEWIESKGYKHAITLYCKKLVCFQYYSFKKMVMFKLINSVLYLSL